MSSSVRPVVALAALSAAVCIVAVFTNQPETFGLRATRGESRCEGNGDYGQFRIMAGMVQVCRP